MRMIPECVDCLYERQVTLAEKLDKEQAEKYLLEIREILDKRDENDAAPYMVYLFKAVQRRFFGSVPVYGEIKETYNRLVLDLEAEIEKKIEASKDPLKTSLLYARLGNYIDFGAMNVVDPEEFTKLLDQADAEGIDEKNYESFLQDCQMGKKFLLLCDNCGEIVFDKLFVRQLKKQFPHLELVALVRGEEALNDATLEDAQMVGLTEEMTVLSNGNGVAGTVIELLSKEAREVFDKADVILSKGQGNYECMNGCGKNVYYTFLCKCDLFTRKFQVPRLTGMFVREV